MNRRASPAIRFNPVVTATVLAMMLLFTSGVGVEQAAPKRILALFWSDKEHPANVRFDDSFQQALRASSDWIEYYPEYLDVDRFPGEAQSLLLRDYLRQKYAGRTIDVIIALADPPLDFLLKYRNELFSNAAIVFIANKAPRKEQLSAGPGITGFININAYRETLDLALRMHPHTEQVFIVSGTLTRDKTYENSYRRELEGYKGRASINYLTDYEPDELTAKVKTLPERSIIHYIWQQARNEQGRLFETTEVLSVLASSASAPIYGVASWQVGNGIVGGYVRNMEANGVRVAERVLQIANGARAQDIPIEVVPVEPVFDARELKRWGISEDLLPAGSTVRFRVPSFWDEYKWYAIAAISVFIVQSALIAALIANRARRKRAEVERGQAKSEVAESRARLAAIITSAIDAIITTDENQRIVLFNHAALRMFGCADNEALGQPIERFIAEESRESYHRYIRALEETSVNARSKGPLETIRGLRADGEEFPIEASISRLELPGQKFYTVILRDITERHRAEQALRESEERFRNMADTAPVMIWISGPDKLCTYFNRQWLYFTGRTMEQELGIGWAEGVHPDDLDRCLETYNTAFNRRERFMMEYRLRRADGQFRWIIDSGTARFSPDGSFAGYIGSCFDITERKTAQEALQDLSGQLIRAREDECARIARELHDDLNQRMALISIELEQLGQSTPDPDGKVRKQLKGILKQASEVSGEIHRISYDLHPSKLTQLGLVAAVNGLCQDLRRSHEVRIEFFHDDVPFGLPEDTSLCLYRIVQESLNNVIKHSGSHEATVELRRTPKDIRLRVSDSGMGFEIESPTLKKGLGLIGMRERLRLVGGTISIESSPSTGTKIEARVPLERAAENFAGDSTEEKTKAIGG